MAEKLIDVLRVKKSYLLWNKRFHYRECDSLMGYNAV
jgi:hypothetical protein